MSPRRTQPCIEACPFPAEQRGNLGCRPTNQQVEGLEPEAMRGYALCATARLNRRDLDSLTGLLTHDRFLAEAAHHFDVLKVAYGLRTKNIPEYARSALLLAADGDGLKRVNDTVGHDKGDQVINVTGRRAGRVTLSHLLGRNEAENIFMGCFREGEAMAARRGGDEFISAIFGISKAEAQVIVTRAARRMGHISVRGLGIAVSATTGSAYGERVMNFKQFQTLAERADIEVNKRKAARRAANPR